ncbi:TonB-dependent receptor [Carboxylicivirga mesophila]|uniref:TonB-dependent receptor n=1 Tax=Carboxylicivirga mesophila TaxID=1166478 RepID=A0ABS5KG84_9BACT|nr:TonB-dependent receptor [Carboxylicivirga mesophila]MBS2213333.1 TonB-dependent receptor [Carboxylicivirga mesophila]
MKKKQTEPRWDHLGIGKILRIMKIMFVLMVAFGLSVSATGFSQNNKLTLRLKNATLLEIFKEIEANTDLGFLYKDDQIDQNKTYSINATNQDIHEVLTQVLNEADYTFTIIENNVVITKVTNTAKTTVVQQRMTVTGQVVDANGEPLPGVNVYDKSNPQNGVITGIDGSYTITVDNADASLMFSFIGFEDQEVQIAGRSQVNITLLEEQIGLEEVVVTGYGTITKEAYTGSAAVVSAKKIEERPVASFQDVLRGNSPGTIVTGTGQPGAMNTVRLRGISSMNASNAPLYVIDGVIMDVSNMSGSSDYATNPLNSINPSDIKSMTILKDAASASLYGSRGANGVIVITTKQGRNTDKPQYSVDVQMGVSQIFNASKPDLVNKDEFMELWLEGEMHYQVRRKTGYDDFFSEIKNLYADKEGYEVSGRNFYEWQNYAKEQFNSHFAIYSPNNDDYYDEFFDEDGNPGADYNKLSNTNWFDEVTRVAPFQKYNVSTNGGNAHFNYYASLEYFNQEGIIIGSGLERYSLRTNLSSKPKGALFHWGINSMVSYSDQSGPRANAYGYAMPQYTALAIAPVAPVYLEDGSYNLSLPKGVNNNQNPVAVANENYYLRPQTKIITSGWIQLNFTDWLNVNSRTNLDYTHARRRNWYNKDFGDGKSDNGSLYERDARSRKISNTTLLNFNKTLNDVHSITAYAGTEVEDLRYQYTGATGINFPTNKTPYLSAAATPESVFGSGHEYGMFSILSQVNYVYNGKYYASASFRTDESSRFSPENRRGSFWSLSGAWRISDEAFLSDVSFLDNLKLKASIGTNGTLPSELYAWQSVYSFGYDYKETPGATPPSIANSDLTWEENQVYNIGFESRWFNRINFNLEYYNRETKNLLQDLPISGTAGFSSMLINSNASLTNQGIEVDVNADIIRNSDFNWNINVNAATLKNRFSGLDNDIIGSTQIQRNGESYYSWYMPEWAGVDPETGEQQWYGSDEDGNEIIVKDYDDAERRILGTALPKVTGGISSSFSWKGIDLSFLFTYGMGHHVMDYTGRTATKNDGYRDYRGIERSQLDRWTPDNTSGTNPIRVNSSGTWNRYRSSRYVYKGDYLKLKNIKLQYTIPVSITQKLKLRSASVFAQAENLWVATELDGFDPEISLSGFRDADQYPTATTYTFGVKLNF